MLQYGLKSCFTDCLQMEFCALPPQLWMQYEVKFSENKSGTEVSVSMYEEIDGLLTMLSVFVRKMLLLKAPKIAVELSVESAHCVESQSQSIVLQNSCRAPSIHAENIDHLKLGFQEYVSKHGNRLVEACHSCFSAGNNLKIGTGIAHSRRNQQSTGQVMEVVIIITEISIPAESSCFRLYGRRTEVLYFRDFLPCSIAQSSLDALASIEWKNYGAMMLPCTGNNQIDKSLTRKAVKLALKELKQNNAGVLLSERAVKICSYVPDLAKTLSGLILSSHDKKFQGECFSLLGLQLQENERNIVENCIKDKIISVVARNDRNSWGTRDVPCLFVDDAPQEPYGLNEECDGREEALGHWDV
ncbi:UNVERIFIED_CONTAM: Type 2 DNA topoisomerase 6 subunit B-like [Sesamum calycinum]|uniref:Type 2 DNA topoisomerase 6 subunit B-like n=1 Tax=Sesamum calycinum TaxID=2727403 RepID=A0AAW2MP76_9LAMI